MMHVLDRQEIVNYTIFMTDERNHLHQQREAYWSKSEVFVHQASPCPRNVRYMSASCPRNILGVSKSADIWRTGADIWRTLVSLLDLTQNHWHLDSYIKARFFSNSSQVQHGVAQEKKPVQE